MTLAIQSTADPRILEVLNRLCNRIEMLEASVVLLDRELADTKARLDTEVHMRRILSGRLNGMELAS